MCIIHHIILIYYYKLSSIDIVSVFDCQLGLTGMGVPEMRATVSVELVSERVSFVNRTLGDVWDTVVVLSSLLVKSVPMDH